MTFVIRLNRGFFHRNQDITEIVTLFRRDFIYGKGQDIGGSIFAAEAGIIPFNLAIVQKYQRELAMGGLSGKNAGATQAIPG